MSKLPKILALFAVAFCACGEGTTTLSAPLDRFTFPTGLALHTLGDGRRALVVVSSNFDLRYDPREGGSVMLVDPDASSGDALSVISGIAMPSMGGPVAVISGRDEPTTPDVDPGCPGWTGGDQLLVASRTANALYRMDLGDDGRLSCGDNCKIDFPSDLVDPFDVATACRQDKGVFVPHAYVTHMGSPTTTGWLTRLDLSAPKTATLRIPLSIAATQNLTWDPARRRLFVTSRFTTIGYAPLRWLDLAFPTAVLGAFDVNTALRGADLRGIALAAPAPDTQFRTRAYVASRVFDQDLAATYGGRPPDVGGALLVVDISDDPTGAPRNEVTRIVPVGIGPSNVAVLPGRPAGQELVAVTTDSGAVALYDALHGSVVRTLATASADSVAVGPFQPLPFEDPAATPGPRDAAVYHYGEKLFGSQPFALAADLSPDGRIRLYVSSFDRGFIAEVLIDPAQPAAAQVTKRFGRRQP